MILALDVGFKNMGWCLFLDSEPVNFGTIKTEKTSKKGIRVSDDRAHRAAYLATELALIINTNGVKGCIAELPSGGAKNAIAMAYMAAGTAVTSAVLSILGIPVEWTTPNEGKLALCGKRSPSKVEMMNAVRKKYPGVEWPTIKAKFEHVADAIGAFVASRDGNIVRLFGQSP